MNGFNQFLDYYLKRVDPNASSEEIRQLWNKMSKIQRSYFDKPKSKEALSRKVLIIYTGGTIGMKETPKGLVPDAEFLREKIRNLSEFAVQPGENITPKSLFGEMVEYKLKQLDPLVDSTEMNAKDWIKIARKIKNEYDNYDGFVVLQGTDTLAYTASALSFMLENLAKPVVVTGSMVPLSQNPSDGDENLEGAIIMAAHFDIPEVTVFFHNGLYRGNRTTKIHADSVDAFGSPNLPPLAKVGSMIRINWDEVLPMPPPGEELRVVNPVRKGVGVLKVYPGIDPKNVEAFLGGMEGCVLEAYGGGNAPSSLNGVFKKAIDNGLVMVCITQNFRGTAVLGHYGASMGLIKAGVVSGYDMKTEGAFTKLSYLLGKYRNNREIVKKKMQIDLRGEMSDAGDLQEMSRQSK